jgi:hypothetical protein
MIRPSLCLLAFAACAAPRPTETAPTTALGAADDDAGPTPLDGPFASLDEAPAPHGMSRTSLLDGHPGGPFLATQLLESSDPTGVEASRCSVAIQLERGWYLGAGFPCERRDEHDTMTIEALAIEIDEGALPPEALIWYLEKTADDQQRTKVIVCQAPTAAAPACAPPVARERKR